MALAVDEARKNFDELMRQVTVAGEHVQIQSRVGDAVLIPAAEFRSWKETAHILGTPANARRFIRAYDQAVSR